MLKKPSSASSNSRSASKSRSNDRCRRLRNNFFFPLLAFFFVSCAGYRLGPTNGIPAGSRSVQVNLFQNQTWEPRLSEPVATSLRRALQQDGTYRLATRGDADIVVDGVIIEFNRSGLSFDPRDVLTVRDYELTLVAKFTATERSTGRVILDSKAAGRTTIRSGADLPSAERQAAPLLAEDLARKIADALADGIF